MTVIIGIDPHKASHTAVAIGGDEQKLAEVKVRATCQQTAKLLTWAEPLGEHTWAVESAGGLGYLLSQQLVGAGERVLDVPATLASRVRVLGTGKSNKNDPNDALSVAIAALRAPGLRWVELADHWEVLRLLAKRNHEIGRLRNIVVSRLHAALANLSPGGISKELNASDAVRLLDGLDPITPVERTRYDLAHELLDDVERLDVQLKESHRRIKTAVKASGTSLTELYGVGPILACELIGYTGDVRRFTNRDQFASYAGVAPVEYSSGGRTFHRLSRRGNRQLNHAVHMVAICQIRQKDSEGRMYFEKKVGRGQDQARGDPVAQAPGQQRRLSPAPYRRTEVRGPGGQGGTTRSLRDRLCTLAAGSSAKSLPDPPNLRHSRPSTAASLVAPGQPGICPLDSKRIRCGTGDNHPPFDWFRPQQRS
jgi:transposase